MKYEIHLISLSGGTFIFSKIVENNETYLNINTLMSSMDVRQQIEVLHLSYLQSRSRYLLFPVFIFLEIKK